MILPQNNPQAVRGADLLPRSGCSPGTDRSVWFVPHTSLITVRATAGPMTPEQMTLPTALPMPLAPSLRFPVPPRGYAPGEGSESHQGKLGGARFSNIPPFEPCRPQRFPCPGPAGEVRMGRNHPDPFPAPLSSRHASARGCCVPAWGFAGRCRSKPEPRLTRLPPSRPQNHPLFSRADGKDAAPAFSRQPQGAELPSSFPPSWRPSSTPLVAGGISVSDAG